MHLHRKHRWHFLPALSLLALAPWSPCTAQANTLGGQLGRGPHHPVLWFASPEPGDLIGQVFCNPSPAGQAIPAHCLPDMVCTDMAPAMSAALHCLASLPQERAGSARSGKLSAPKHRK